MNEIRILYAEDLEPIRNTVKESLELENWQVDACPDGRSALKLLEGGVHYDVIILDQHLPDMSTLDLIRRARALHHRSQTPIIIFAGGGNMDEALEAGATTFLTKPSGILELPKTVRSLLQDRRTES